MTVPLRPRVAVNHGSGRAAGNGRRRRRTPLARPATPGPGRERGSASPAQPREQHRGSVALPPRRPPPSAGDPAARRRPRRPQRARDDAQRPRSTCARPSPRSSAAQVHQPRAPLRSARLGCAAGAPCEPSRERRERCEHCDGATRSPITHPWHAGHPRIALRPEAIAAWDATFRATTPPRPSREGTLLPLLRAPLRRLRRPRFVALVSALPPSAGSPSSPLKSSLARLAPRPPPRARRPRAVPRREVPLLPPPHLRE